MTACGKTCVCRIQQSSATSSILASIRHWAQPLHLSDGFSGDVADGASGGQCCIEFRHSDAFLDRDLRQFLGVHCGTHPVVSWRGASEDAVPGKTMWCVGTDHNVGRWTGSGWEDKGHMGGWQIQQLLFDRNGTNV